MDPLRELFADLAKKHGLLGKPLDTTPNRMPTNIPGVDVADPPSFQGRQLKPDSRAKVDAARAEVAKRIEELNASTPVFALNTAEFTDAIEKFSTEAAARQGLESEERDREEPTGWTTRGIQAVASNLASLIATAIIESEFGGSPHGMNANGFISRKCNDANGKFLESQGWKEGDALGWPEVRKQYAFILEFFLKELRDAQAYYDRKSEPQSPSALAAENIVEGEEFAASSPYTP